VLDARTSLFLYVILAVVAAFGLAGAARAGYELVRLAARTAARFAVDRSAAARTVVTPRLAGGRRAVAVLGALVAAAILVGGGTAYAVYPVRSYVRVVAIRLEENSTAVTWLQTRMRPGDVLRIGGLTPASGRQAEGCRPSMCDRTVSMINTCTRKLQCL